MQERDVFLDCLAGTKHSINCYTTAIMETSNQQLRSTWQTLRNEAEQMQYQIYQMAEQKGYYVPAPKANHEDIQKIKSTLTSAVNNNSNMSGSSGGNIYSSGSTNPNLHFNTDTTPSMVNSNNQNMSSSTNQGLKNSNMPNQVMTNSTNQHQVNSSKKTTKNKK